MPITGTFPNGANGIRTRDLLLAKQALSQLSYGPVRDECRGVDLGAEDGRGCETGAEPRAAGANIGAG